VAVPIDKPKATDDKPKPEGDDENEDETKPEPREFKPPPKTPDEVVEQEEEKFAEREAERLEGEDKVERIKAIKDEEDEQRKGIEEFFEEPWPGMSFTTIRRRLRRDIEALGNGYLEVIRNVKGDIVFLNHLDAKLVRLVRLGKPIQVEQEITRFGKTTKVQVLKRERRYAMLIGARTTVTNVTRVMYFKEFAASRDINKWNGLWDGTDEDNEKEVNAAIQRPETPSVDAKTVQPVPVPGLTGLLTTDNKNDIGGPVADRDKGTEIIHFTAIHDYRLPVRVDKCR